MTALVPIRPEEFSLFREEANGGFACGNVVAGRWSVDAAPARAVATTRIGLAAALLAFALLPATAPGATTSEQISFVVTDASQPGAMVVGELRIPDGKRERLPAVLIVNSSPGFDGRGAFYAEALNEAGIATLEVDLYQGKGIPASPSKNMPHVFQSLQFLARQPRIDGKRIGIMGFSWGGIVAVMSSSDALARQYAGGELRFAAHLGLYPICWRHHQLLVRGAGPWKDLNAAVYRKVTGRPVHVLAGARDDYGEPDTCAKFVAALPGDVRRHFAVTVYPEATFAWDSTFGSATYEASARMGKGGIVNVVADPEIARQSREFAVSYFRRHLAAE